MIDADKCLDFTMCSITKRASKERIVAECTATLEGERLKRVGYVIGTLKTTIKNRNRSQTTIFGAEQEAIIKAIYISTGNRATLIATDSLSTIMAVEGTK
jgi:hypothetical protein